jgi:hypothetical protein
MLTKSPFCTLVSILSCGLVGLQVLFIYAIFIHYGGTDNPIESVYTLTHNLYVRHHDKHTSIIKERSKKTTTSAAFMMNVLEASLPVSKHDDLRMRSRDEIMKRLDTISHELPMHGNFLSQYKNPCWYPPNEDQVVCLPYVYLLGQPKSGTTDLFVRLVVHPEIMRPIRKEIRWFTKGEFREEAIGDIRLHPETSIKSFTFAFKKLAMSIESNPNYITIDGGPHTLWWSTQAPDGSSCPEDIPAPQILREMQPDAKFIISLTDPVKRMYSDYNFIDDNLLPVTPSSVKSPEEFHMRAVSQVVSNYCTLLIRVIGLLNVYDIIKP